MYTFAIPIVQVIQNMEKALYSKLREKNKSGDKRLVAKKQRGRWTQWVEGLMFSQKKHLVARVSVHTV